MVKIVIKLIEIGQNSQNFASDQTVLKRVWEIFLPFRNLWHRTSQMDQTNRCRQYRKYFYIWEEILECFSNRETKIETTEN